MSRYLDRSSLEVEEPVAEHLGNPELGKPGAGFVGEVVGHFQVDVVRRYQRLPRPALFDDLEQFVRDVDAEPVVPPVLEPFRELERSVVVENVHVQLALCRQTGEGQVAASQVADDGVYGIVAKQEVELRVQRVAQKELDDDLLGAKLRGQLPQGPLVGVGGSADSELLAKLFGQLDSQAVRRLVIDARGPIDETQGIPEVIVRKALHPDEYSARSVTRLPICRHAAQDRSIRED